MAFPDWSSRRPLLLDGFERVAITALFVWLAYRFAASIPENPANLLFLAAEAVVAVMVLLRRPTSDISQRPVDWLLGVSGTMLPMLIGPAGGGWAGGVALVIAGMILSLGAKLSLRRSFGVVAANRGIKRTGLYAAVRHPMYLGYFVLYAGVLLLNPSLWNALLLVVWGGVQIGRISVEERILMRDADYQAHARQVRFRLLPMVY